MKSTRFPYSAGLALATTSILLLNACASVMNPIGSNKYDCNRKENPDSKFCHSFRAVEASTNGDLPDSRFDTELKLSEYDKDTDIAPIRKRKAVEHPAMVGIGQNLNANTTSTEPHDAAVDGMPVRLGPVVQRTWIKHFVDANDMLTGDTKVYKEVVPPRWSGFDAGNPLAKFGGSYPHRADNDTAGSTNVAQVKAPVGAPPQSNSTSDFIQPGQQSSPGSENPGGSSLPPSMPQ